jgi:dienelactone hydrolase
LLNIPFTRIVRRLMTGVCWLALAAQRSKDVESQRRAPCQFEVALSAGTNFTWHEFIAAHAFMRDEGARYDAAAARIVYAMALDLFHRKLSEGDLTQIRGSART